MQVGERPAAGECRLTLGVPGILTLLFVPLPLELVYRPPNFDGRGCRHPPDGSRVMVDPDRGGTIPT